MLKVGSVLGRYELIAHLKNGGMAALYLGRRIDPPDNRIFAIKVIHPHFLDDQDLVQMFLDEAGLALRIQHKNVVHVDEVGEDRQMHFIAMEYIHGCSLAQLLQALIRLKRRMSPELAVYVAMNVLEGLHAAHELRGDAGEPLNVVHRDVSPQNILLAHNGEISLIDFGIAKSRMRVHHSQTGTSIRGKLRYMAPEHARGHEVDRRTDVYALGIVLWETLTMRPLFWANSDFGVLAKIRDPKAERPSKYAPRIRPDLDRAVLTALSPDPSGRPESAWAFRRMLSKAVPLAEALDEDQVAELLHVILGEELGRQVQDLPHIVSSELSLTGRETVPLRPDIPEKVLDTLTDPSIDISELEGGFSFEGLPPDEEVSHAPDAKGARADFVDIGSEEVDDRTELMSNSAILDVHRALDAIRARSFEEGRKLSGLKLTAGARGRGQDAASLADDHVPATISDAKALPEDELPDRTVVDGAPLEVDRAFDDELSSTIRDKITLGAASGVVAPAAGPRTPPARPMPTAVEVMRILPSRVPTDPLGSVAAPIPPPVLGPSTDGSAAPGRPAPSGSAQGEVTGGPATPGWAPGRPRRESEFPPTDVGHAPYATGADHEAPDEDVEPPTETWHPGIVRRAMGQPAEGGESYAGLIAAVLVIGVILAVIAGILLL